MEENVSGWGGGECEEDGEEENVRKMWKRRMWGRWGGGECEKNGVEENVSGVGRRRM